VVILRVAEEKWLDSDIAVKLMVYVLQPGVKHLVSEEFQMSWCYDAYTKYGFLGPEVRPCVEEGARLS
jgi:hypothetical protein